MDAPQQANAAQMAARNIRAKPKGRTGRPGGPSSSRGPNSVPQFVSMPSQNDGGLFGGSVQGAGTFNFSAPGNMTLAPPSFGSNTTPSPDVSDSEGRFAGDDRATKRQFGGASTIPAGQSGFQQTNPFGQSQPGNSFGSAQPTQGGNSFSFGGSSGPSGNSFGAGSAPVNNPFNFGSTSQAASASINFGSGPSGNLPGNSSFNFGQQASQPQVSNSTFTFGASAPQAQPSNTQPQTSNSIFSFGSQAAQSKPTFTPQTSNSPFNFGSSAAPAQPANAPFQFGQSSGAPSSSGVSFGAAPASSAPTNNIFGPPSQAPPPSNMFGSSNQQSAPANNIFGKLNAPATATSNPFGSREPSPAPASTLFNGHNEQPTTSTNNFFGTPKQTPAPSTLFGEQKTSTPSTSNIFGGLPKPSSTSNMFGGLNQQAPPVSDLFGKAKTDSTATKDLFGTLNKPVDESVKYPKLNGNGATVLEESATPGAGSTSIFNKTPAANLFGQAAPLNNTNNEEQKSNGVKASFSFGSASQGTNSSNIFSTAKPVDTPAAASQPITNGAFSDSSQVTKYTEPAAVTALQTTISQSAAGNVVDFYKAKLDPFNVTEEQMAPLVPIGTSESDKHNFYTASRIRYLNHAMVEMFKKIPLDANPQDCLLQYMEARRKLQRDDRAPEAPHNPMIGNGKSLQTVTPSSPFKQALEAPPQEQSKRKLVLDEDQENENPSKRSKEPPTPSQAPSLGEPRTNGSNSEARPATSSPMKSMTFGQNSTFSAAPPVATPAKGKRKAEEQITKDTEEVSAFRKMKTPKMSGSDSGSITSNIFKDILDTPSKSTTPARSPEKKMASIKASKDDTPRFNPFGKLPVPASPSKAPASPAFAPVAKTFTFKPTFTANNPAEKPAVTANSSGNIFTPKVAAAAPSTGIKPPTFGSGTVNFLSQFGQQAEKSKLEAEAARKKKWMDNEYDSDDDDETLEEAEARYEAHRKAELKELEALTKAPGKAFSFAPSGGVAAKADTKAPLPKSEPAPPTAGSSTFFSQKLTPQDSASSVFGSGNNSRSSSAGLLGSSTGSVLDGNTPAKLNSGEGNMFGHLIGSSSGKANDADSPEEESDNEGDGDEENKDPNYKPGEEDVASGPGTPASETGAGIASTKKANPFGSLGTAGSPFGSGTSTPSGGLFGRMGSKEPPSTEKETGGTSTPGGSLFDRITKDSNGNAVRHISTEEKENTQPSSANIFKESNPFGSLNKTSAAPADQTWKPDSPIRFGGATSGSAPTVSITAATPTKAGSSSNLFGGPSPAPAPFSTLFGNKSEAKPAAASPFSNLFGNTGTAKPSASSVGFGFGASSATSSLLPSANTSRATSPGATTDGDSGVENDPDAERHEQINLTAGGPGEEDETVLQEFRAKALKWGPKEDETEGWVSKGVGPLRVLQHNDTKATRVLLRADPSGSIVLNKAVLPQLNYQAAGKTVKLLTAADKGSALETWLLQVKTPEIAKELAELLDANKGS